MIEILLEAERALSVGLLDRAETLYQQVAAADPRNSIAVVGLARVTLDRGDDVAALELARRALAIDPENVAAQRMVARLEEVLEYREADLSGASGATGTTPTTSRGRANVTSEGDVAEPGPAVVEPFAEHAQPEPPPPVEVAVVEEPEPSEVEPEATGPAPEPTELTSEPTEFEPVAEAAVAQDESEPEPAEVGPAADVAAPVSWPNIEPYIGVDPREPNEVEASDEAADIEPAHDPVAGAYHPPAELAPGRRRSLRDWLRRGR